MTENSNPEIRHAWASPAGSGKSWTPEDIRIGTKVWQMDAPTQVVRLGRGHVSGVPNFD